MIRELRDRALNWLTASPRRLVLAVVSVVMVGILATINAANGADAPVSAPPAPRATAPVRSSAPSPSAPVTAPSPSRTARATAPASSDAQHPARRSRRAALATARTYLTVFLDHQLDDATWRRQLEAVSTPTLARLNASVPRDQITGHLRRAELTLPGETFARVTARLAGGPDLAVALVLDEHGAWRVTEVAPITTTPGDAGE